MFRNDPRWKEIDALLDGGQKPLEIARQLCLTESLVKKHRDERNLRAKREAQATKRQDEVMSRVLHMGDDESFVIAMLRLAVKGKYLADRLEIPQIVNARFEYEVGMGRLDLVVESLGAIYTLVEAKKVKTIRDAAMAIGQLHVYEVLFREKLARHGINPSQVYRLMACQNLDEPLRSTVIEACASAKVAVMFVGEFGSISQLASSILGGR